MTQLHTVCRAVVPGTTFPCRLYNKVADKDNHLHVDILSTAENDLATWREFLTNFTYLRPTPSLEVLTSDTLQLYIDASTKVGLDSGITVTIPTLLHCFAVFYLPK